MAYSNLIAVLVFTYALNGVLSSYDPPCHERRVRHCVYQLLQNTGFPRSQRSLPLDIADLYAQVAENNMQNGETMLINRAACEIVYSFMGCIGDQLATCVTIDALRYYFRLDEQNAAEYALTISVFSTQCASLFGTENPAPDCSMESTSTPSFSVVVPDGCCQGYYICGKDQSDDHPGLVSMLAPPLTGADLSGRLLYYTLCGYGQTVFPQAKQCLPYRFPPNRYRCPRHDYLYSCPNLYQYFVH